VKPEKGLNDREEEWKGVEKKGSQLSREPRVGGRLTSVAGCRSEARAQTWGGGCGLKISGLPEEKERGTVK